MRLNVEQQSRNHYSQKELNSLTRPWIDLPLNDLTFPRTITVTLYYESLRPLRRAKSRVLIPEYKWHFQEHASDRPSRTNRRRLTGSICNILSRDGRKGRERKREREKHSAVRKCLHLEPRLHFSFLYLSHSPFFGKGKKSLREMAPPFGWGRFNSDRSRSLRSFLFEPELRFSPVSTTDFR